MSPLDNTAVPIAQNSPTAPSTNPPLGNQPQSSTTTPPQTSTNPQNSPSPTAPTVPPSAGITDEEAVAIAQAVVKQPLVQQGQLVEEPKKNLGGRPSKYNEGMLNKANKYIYKCLNGEPGFDKNGKRIIKQKLPLLEELARICGVDSETLMNWTKEDERFFDAIKRVKELQKERIIQKGFSATNPTFSIFMLKANHGMMETEKQVLVQDRDVKVSITRE